MKKILLSLIAVVMAFVANAQDPVVTMTPTTSNMTSIGSYTSDFTLTQTEGTWTIYGFNNNNLGWSTNPIRCGRKGTASTAKISTDFAMTATINKVEIDVTRTQTNGGAISSLTLKVSEDNTFVTTTDYTVDVTSQPTSKGTTVTFTVDITNSVANRYYQLYFELDDSNSSKNGFYSVDEVRYYGTVAEGEVAYPVITPAGGTYLEGESVEVAISCATEGATLSYTIDGGEAIEYTAPFTVTEACTIVATATNGTDTKTSGEAVFTFVEPVSFGYVTKVTSGKKYLIVAESADMKVAATPLSGNYGYIGVTDVTPENGYIKLASDVNAFTITETTGGYTIQDSNGKYLYQTGSYNSFNVAEENPADGSEVWTIALNNDGTGSMTITNTSVGKWIQFATNYNSYGSYDSLQTSAILPRLYEEGATAMEDPVVGVEAVGVDANAPVEYYNLQGVKVENPAGGLFIKHQGTTATKVIL